MNDYRAVIQDDDLHADALDDHMAVMGRNDAQAMSIDRLLCLNRIRDFVLICTCPDDMPPAYNARLTRTAGRWENSRRKACLWYYTSVNSA